MTNTREELSAEMMEQVNGGTKYYHEGCGGTLWNAGDPFSKVEC